MALHAHYNVTPIHARSIASHTRRDPALMFWSIAIPASLLFWAAVAYGIHSAF